MGHELHQRPSPHFTHRRIIAVDDRCLTFLRQLVDETNRRAEAADVQVVDDPYLLTVSMTGDEPWDPDTITQYFGRLRKGAGLDHLELKGLRRFMDTYGQELGFSMAQVTRRAGHDRAVAGKHHTGRVAETDRAVAAVVPGLIGP